MTASNDSRLYTPLNDSTYNYQLTTIDDHPPTGLWLKTLLDKV